MSETPMPKQLFKSPEEAFMYMLKIISCTQPYIWLAKIRPHLLTFISHPTIKELIGQSDAPAQTSVDTSPKLDLQKIQDSLLQLSKAVEALKKAPPSPPSNKDANASKSKQKLSTPHLHFFGNHWSQALQPQPFGGLGKSRHQQRRLGKTRDIMSCP